MKKVLFLALGFCLLLSSPLLAAQNAVVIVPLADLRSDPSPPAPGISDDQEQTQLLLGERLTVDESSGAWVRVEALDQPSFKYHHRWQGYPGWVLHSAIQEISHFPAARAFPSRTPEQMRQDILQAARQLIGAPYLWGGLSPRDLTGHAPLSGIDCSGLVHLSYRKNGLTVPRDSCDQYVKAEKIKRAQLRPADLIFSASPKDPQKIIHVMLYAGGDTVIEAPRTGLAVREITFKEKTGRPLASVESGDTLPDRVVYFGRLLNDADHPIH